MIDLSIHPQNIPFVDLNESRNNLPTLDLNEYRNNLHSLDLHEYLNNIPLDTHKAIPEINPNQILPVPNTVNRLETFILAIKKKDIHYFDCFQNTIYFEYYQELREAFYMGRILKNRLADYFNALEGTKHSSIAFMRKLRSIDDHFFNDALNLKNAKKADSKYNINSIYNEYYSAPVKK